MKKDYYSSVLTLLGALALPLRAQKIQGTDLLQSRIEGLPNDILGMLSLYVRPLATSFSDSKHFRIPEFK